MLFEDESYITAMINTTRKPEPIEILSNFIVTDMATGCFLFIYLLTFLLLHLWLNDSKPTKTYKVKKYIKSQSSIPKTVFIIIRVYIGRFSFDRKKTYSAVFVMFVIGAEFQKWIILGAMNTDVLIREKEFRIEKLEDYLDPRSERWTMHTRSVGSFSKWVQSKKSTLAVKLMEKIDRIGPEKVFLAFSGESMSKFILQMIKKPISFIFQSFLNDMVIAKRCDKAVRNLFHAMFYSSRTSELSALYTYVHNCKTKSKSLKLEKM